MRQLVARISARVFVGSQVCRDPEWLKLSVDFSIDMFTTAFTLRMFPPWTHPLIARLIPARSRIKKGLQKACCIIGPLIEKHQDAIKRRDDGKSVSEEDTLLHWMMDHGDTNEVEVKNMASRQVILTLASIHTTSMAVTNILFDLCAHPEWFDVLREEISQVVNEPGTAGLGATHGAKDWLPALEKLDSFFNESQRVNPPILRKFQPVS